ncbi:hypothetical protein NKDENANG_02215 [Candidatus Entotheonellaceae bacterium PAL068K]
MTKRWAALVKRDPQVVRVLLPDEPGKHVLKPEHGLGGKALGGGQRLAHGKKRPIDVGSAIDQIDA